MSSSEDFLPIYVPLLVSLTMPIMCTFVALWNRYVLVNQRVSPFVYNFAYNILYAGAATIAGIVHFSLNPSSFEISLFIVGFSGSLLNTVGTLFSNAA